MDTKPILKSLDSIEKKLNLVLIYSRISARHISATNPDTCETWLDDQEVMERLHIGSKTLYRRRKSGMLPYKQIMKKYYYRESDVLALLTHNTVVMRAGRKREKGSKCIYSTTEAQLPLTN